MSEQVLAVTGGCLAAVLLVLLVTRTVLVERRAGVGGERPRRVSRTWPVRTLDTVAALLVVALLVALVGRIAVALNHV